MDCPVPPNPRGAADPPPQPTLQAVTQLCSAPPPSLPETVLLPREGSKQLSCHLSPTDGGAGIVERLLNCPGCGKYRLALFFNGILLCSRPASPPPAPITLGHGCVGPSSQPSTLNTLLSNKPGCCHGGAGTLSPCLSREMADG